MAGARSTNHAAALWIWGFCTTIWRAQWPGSEGLPYSPVRPVLAAGAGRW